MGLLDSVLGAVAGNNTSSAAGGGLGGILGALAQNPQIMQAITGMLGIQFAMARDAYDRAARAWAASPENCAR